MGLPTMPTDLYVQNGWYFDFPGLINPHFETLEGVQQTTQNVSIVNAGNNRKYSFGAQIIDFGEMTLTRTYQGTPDDISLDAIVQLMLQEGLKLDVMANKLHHQQEVFRVYLQGFKINIWQMPTWDVNGEDKFVNTYQATCDDWTIIR
jgi:hypothetical protein